MIDRGTRCVVTGGSSGIGAETAAALGSRGCEVLITGRDRKALADVARGTGARMCVADLTEPDGIATVLAEAGEVDVLVCNAGVGWAGSFADMPAAAIDRLVATNLLAPARLIRGVLPGMLARGSGALGLVSSIAGSMSVADEAVYSATKAGVAALGASVRGEVTGKGVTVSVVVPGVVSTPFFDRRGTPYRRSRPRPVPASTVAEALVAALEHGRPEVFVPRWLRFPARLRGVAPGLTDSLQRRFG
ncbi:short-chain dehydrogenase [Prauserella marina]|uniref:Short-chain dehydrogenase n=1 Tax=Prauserella marina TaxID=530584 RepID=A0A222VPV2_9PSEU|nr:SDR family NAD(P)-dependent oxidoreductase [Prauserella marina]ASR35948.1 short-chain dehydrogenase [Prauserella marina]PWV84124.1 short-subunit dehydrogenase [Prauserella marina]SDC29784.1 Short-chain dehydrogenase [Prauserella marina]